jgi:hypothetical protein
MARRGEAVHRAKASSPGEQPRPHQINKDELRKSIQFLKNLVDATDAAFET